MITKENNKDLKELEKFYARKAREATGGQYYKVIHKGVKKFTEWAHSYDELRAWLVSKQIPFTEISPLE